MCRPHTNETKTKKTTKKISLGAKALSENLCKKAVRKQYKKEECHPLRMALLRLERLILS